MAEPYDTYVENYETLAEVGATTAKVIAVCGRSDYVIGDQLKVDWGTTENTADFTVPGDSMNGKAKGDVVTCSLTGLPAAPAPFWFRLNVIFDGTEYYGDWQKAYTLPATTQTVLIQNMSDGHVLESINAGQTWRTAIMANTVANMTADAEALALPTLRSSTGDDVPFAKGQVAASLFPINEDGTTISGSNTHYAQSLTDTRRDCRLFKGIFGELFRNAMFLRTQGNHDAPQWWHYAANNSSHNDAATYSYQAFNEHFGNAANSSGWTGDANGLWGTIRFGPVLCCYMNPYPATILRTTATSSAPRMPDDNNDWTLDQTQWDHFFNSSTGTIATADIDETPFIVVFIHNMLGANSSTGFEAYGWGGARFISEKRAIAAGQVFETGPGNAWTNPYGYTGDHQQLGLHRALVERALRRGIKVLVVYGHAHFYARQWVEGIPYVMCGRSAGGNPNVGDHGFRNAGGWWTGTAWTDTSPDSVFRANAGHINIIASSKLMQVQYKKSIVSGQTSQDGFTTNNEVADEFFLYSESNTLRLSQPITRSASIASKSVRQVSKSVPTVREIAIHA